MCPISIGQSLKILSTSRMSYSDTSLIEMTKNTFYVLLLIKIVKDINNQLEDYTINWGRLTSRVKMFKWNTPVIFNTIKNKTVSI